MRQWGCWIVGMWELVSLLDMARKVAKSQQMMRGCALYPREVEQHLILRDDEEEHPQCLAQQRLQEYKPYQKNI